LLRYRPHFSIGPLVPNRFNYCKSDIKAIEAYATGSVFIGTAPFYNGKPSPYDNCFLKLHDRCSVQDIENMIEEHTNPDKFNDIINKQYQYLIDAGRYTESPKFINYLLSII